MKTGLIFVMGRRLSQTQAQDVSSSLCTQLLALASAHSLMGFRPLLDDIRGIAVEKRADAARPGIGLVPAVYKMTKRINGRIQGFVITIYRINTQRDRIPSPVMEQMEASNQLMPEEAHSNFVSTSINQWLYDQMALSQQPGPMVYKDRVANGVALPAYLPNQHEISADGTEKYTLATFNRYDLGTAQGTPDTIAKRTAEFFATMGQTLEVKVISFNDAQSYFNTFTGPARAAVNWFFTGDPPDEGEVNTQRRRRRDDGDVGVCFAHPPGQRNTLGEFYTLGDMTALPTELGCPIFGGFGNSSSSVPDDTTADDPPTCFGLDDQKYVGVQALDQAIQDFCDEALEQGEPDEDSGSLLRSFNEGSDDAVDISVDFHESTSAVLSYCREGMGRISSGCDGGDPTKNPNNYKGGGSLKVGDALYNIYPKTKRGAVDQKWQSGTCVLAVHHDYSPGGTVGGNAKVTVDATDSNGKKVASLSHTTVDLDVQKDYDVPDIMGKDISITAYPWGHGIEFKYQRRFVIPIGDVTYEIKSPNDEDKVAGSEICEQVDPGHSGNREERDSECKFSC